MSQFSDSSPTIALSNNLADAVEKAGSSVVAVNGRSRISSSGIHWLEGIIITADHTLKREEEITVTLPSGKTVPTTVVGRDASTDVAVLKLQDVELTVAEIGDPSSLKVGHLVLAVGRSSDGGVSASMGVISALGEAWRSMYGGLIDQFIRLDLTLYPGSEGSPLVDASGRVMGINTPGPRGKVLTIPAITVNRVVNQLLEKGHISRGYLGVGMQPVRLTDTLRSQISLPNKSAVIVINIEPKGAADKAGVMLGDVLVTLDGNSINDISDVQAVLGPESVGKTIKAELIRGGALVELAIDPSERGGLTNG